VLILSRRRLVPGNLAQHPWRLGATLGVVAAFTWLWLVHAWVSDDAMITLRQVINFGHGHGIVWNLGERVQGFTHPFWFFGLALGYLVTDAVYATTFMLSFAASATAFGILLWRSEGRLLALTPILGLLFAQSVVDYSSSGLETPASYALLTLAGVLFLDRRAGPVFFLVLALAFLTRMDHALLMLPMALVAWRARGYRPGDIAPAVALVAAWFAFATAYFGYPLPNTFLAKLGPTVDWSTRLAWFTDYARVTLQQDPMTPLLCALGVAVGAGRRDRTAAIALGLVVYAGYLVLVGGDFMRGRMFSPPAVLATLVLVDTMRTAALSGKAARVALPVIGALTATATVGAKPLLNTWHYSNKTIVSGIADERGFYYRHYGLLSPNRALPSAEAPAHRQTTGYRRKCGGIGAVGMRSPDVVKTDTCGLTDPYLARLPAYHTKPGHLVRHPPTDFRGWRLRQIAHLHPPALDRYLRDVRKVVTGRFWSAERWAALGRVLWYDHHVNRDRFRADNGPPRYSPSYLAKLARTVDRKARFRELPTANDGTDWRMGRVIGPGGIRLTFAGPRQVERLPLHLDHNDRYLVALMNGSEVLARTLVSPERRGGLQPYVWAPGSRAAANAVVVKPMIGDGTYSIARSQNAQLSRQDMPADGG